MNDNSDAGSIQWTNEFPGQEKLFIPIVSPKVGSTTRVIITSEKWQGVYTHYFDCRTRPCTGSELDCDGCFKKLSRRWKAYLCGALMPNGRKVIVELTHGAMQGCPELVQTRESLRGRRLAISRNGTARNSSVRCTLEPSTSELFIPEPFDLMAALCKVWGVNFDPPASFDFGRAK